MMSELENEIHSVIVGTKNYSGAIDAIARMQVGHEVRLEREPSNKHDHRAVRCVYLGVMVGYIPRKVNVRLAPQMDAGMIATATVSALPVIRNGNWIQTEPKLRVTLGEPQQ